MEPVRQGRLCPGLSLTRMFGIPQIESRRRCSPFMRVMGAPSRVVGLALLLFSDAPTRAAQDSGDLTTHPGTGSVQDLRAFVDYSRGLAFDSVLALAESGAFQPVRGVPKYRYQDVAVWLRFVVGSLEGPWLLKVGNASLDSLHFFRPDGEGSYEVVATGDGYRFETREISSRTFLFRLPDAREHQVFYLRAASLGPLYIPLSVSSVDGYWASATRELLWLGVFFGVLGVMALYHLVLFVSIRDRAYLYYVLLILALLLYELAVERVGLAYLWPNAVWWAERSNTTLGLLSIAAGAQFSRSYLELKEYAPPWNQLLTGASVFALGLVGINLLGMRTELVYATIVFVLVGIASMLAAGYVALRRGNRSARHYLVAWSFLLAGVFIWTLGYLQIIEPSGVLRNASVPVGASLEVVLFAFGLGHRYNEMRTAREQLRLRIASDLHDEVGSSLTQISLTSSRLQRQLSGSAADDAVKIGSLARSLTATVRDIVLTLEPRKDNWDAIEMHMKDYAAHLLSPAGIAFDMQGEAAVTNLALPFEVRHNLLMLFKEALHNAVKHARASVVSVRWNLNRKRLWMRMEDDGCGFDPATICQGAGLTTMRRRADAMRAEFAVHAAPGRPTVIEVTVPI